MRLAINFLTLTSVVNILLTPVYANSASGRGVGLEKVIESVLIRNPQILENEERVREKIFFLEKSKAERFPFLSTSASLGSGNMMGISNVQSYLIEVNQPIYSGGRITNSINKSEFEEKATSARLEASKKGFILSTTRAYYEVLRSRQMLEIKNNNIQTLQSYEDLVKERFRLGTGSTYEVNEAALEVQKAQYESRTIRNMLDISCSELLNLMIESNVSICNQLIEPQIKNRPNIKSAELIQIALENRAEITAAQLDMEAAKAEENIAKSELRPQVGISGKYGYTNDPLINGDWAPTGSSSLKPTWSVVVGVRVPISDFGRTKNNVSSQQSREEQIRLALDGLKIQISKEAHQTLLGLDLAYDGFLFYQEAEKLAKVTLDQAHAEFLMGKITPTAVLQKINGFNEAQSKRSQASYEVVEALAQLNYVAGKIILP